MIHYIIVKFNDEINEMRKDAIKNKEFKKEIEDIFFKLKDIEGISDIKVVENIIDKPNRYDIIIKIDMKKDVLPIYDESAPHKEWKEKFGTLIKGKVIFDEE